MIGNNLYKLRKKAKLTQEELGKLLNISNVSYGAYERNESLPPVDKLISLANFYNVSTDYLLDMKKNEKENFNFTNEEISIIKAAIEIIKKNT
jgi:transcriptional regulator with XRE-family HTH domain